MSKVIIMGGGPAGLASAYKLQENNLKSYIFEADSQVGGISKTINYKNFYFDLGGHRFFTKFGEVNELWNNILKDNLKNTPRLSRIYYNNKFFNYPLTPMNALLGMGIANSIGILFSYLKSKLFPYQKEETFEQWVSNKFGKKLYSIFFKTYTEKVWGIPCSFIQAEWAAQRIKNLSLKTAILNSLFKSKNTNIKTLIDEFHYPVLGPGMMYEEMKNQIIKMHGKFFTNTRVSKVCHENSIIKSIEYTDENQEKHTQEGEHFISSIPVTELISILSPSPSEAILNAAKALKYRSLITVDIIINKKNVFPDNWIYIHSPDVKLGRIQNFKNWSLKMIPDQNKTSLGLEYFCNENDEFYNMTNEELFKIAASEIEKLCLCKSADIEDYTVIRIPKAYPVYDIGYKKHINLIKDYLKEFRNLELAGRYGLFKYNNMDHSILTGLHSATNIIKGKRIYDTWNINVDEEYHEEIK